jgi:YHS domain-containing protein
MKRVFILLLMVTLSAVLIMCSGEQKQEAQEEATEEATTVVADTGKAMCAACEMEMDKAQMVSHEIDGETHHFCNEDCKNHYLAQKEEEAKTKE